MTSIPLQHRWARPLMLVIAVLAMAVGSPARGQGEAPATQPAGVAIEGRIRALLPALHERTTGKGALEQLQGMRDEKVLTLFEQIGRNELYEWKDAIVLGIERPAGEARLVDVYDLFVPVDADGRPTGIPIETVPLAEISSRSYSVPRPIRSQILAALRVLGLRMEDPRVRKKAAVIIGTRRQIDALPELRGLAADDPDAGVRRAAGESAALIVASGMEKSATPEQKREAIVQLGEYGSIRALDMLRQDAPQATTPEDSRAYSQAIERIERHQSITDWIKNLFFGLSAGSIFVLLALGLAITFGLMGVINMAHGEMMMIGAVTTWACCEFIAPRLPVAYADWYYVIALPLSFLTAAAVGLLVEVTIVRWLYKRPLDSLLATIGVSYILIQAVRRWNGDNLQMKPPTWANGNWEIYQDILLPYNRLFLIALTIFCLVSVIVLFRYTKLGLMIRATVQNREMAQALGVNTRLVDMTTFAFGAGLAGLAGYGIVLTSNPTPEMGQAYIVKSFLTVVVGGVGKLAGVVVSGLGLGFIEKLLEPISLIEKPIKLFDATWAQVAGLLAVILFMQRRPAGLFPDKGRMADQADRTSAPLIARVSRTGDRMLGAALILLGLVLVPILYASGMMSIEYINKLGYILAFAICAIGLDLIWGYIGVLSLTQFLFFAVGGYCMGLYLVNYGPQSADGIPMALSYVMSDVAERSPPWFLGFFKSFPLTVLLGLVLPGLLALLIGLTTFRSRVRGVYFSILTQAITVAFWLVFQKNEMKLGGTNGLTNFTHILGFPIQASDAGPFAQTRFWLYVASLVSLIGVIWIAKALVNSGFGRVLVAIRDDETRLRFVGYQTWAYKASAFAIAAMFAGIGGMLYVPQKGIITPRDLAAIASIQVVAWVAVGGRGTIWGAAIGAIFVGLVYDKITSVAPDYWYYTLGAMFIIVPLLLPGGIMSLPMVIRRLLQQRRSESPGVSIPAAAAVEGGVR